MAHSNGVAVLLSVAARTEIALGSLSTQAGRRSAAVPYAAVATSVHFLNSSSARSQSVSGDPTGQPRSCQSSYARAAIAPSSTVSVGPGRALGSLVTDFFGSIFIARLAMLCSRFSVSKEYSFGIAQRESSGVRITDEWQRNVPSNTSAKAHLATSVGTLRGLDEHSSWSIHPPDPLDGSQRSREISLRRSILCSL